MSTIAATPRARQVDLPRGARLVVRDATVEDLGGLVDLYGSMSVDDRYRRFFSCFRPDRSFFEVLLGRTGRGDVLLVAVLEEPAAPPRVVGEAGYVLLPNGDGELSIAVAAGSRGWLGPFLLDALLDAAAGRGVPNLEADVLTGNAPMLALLRHRGAVTMGHVDWSIVRLLVSSSGGVPTWPERSGRTRVLVEAPGGRWRAAPEAAREGLEVLGCPGPGSSPWPCPVLVGERCPLVDGADVVLVSHPRTDDRWAALVAGHAAMPPEAPVCIEHGGGLEDRDPDATVVPDAAPADAARFVADAARSR